MALMEVLAREQLAVTLHGCGFLSSFSISHSPPPGAAQGFFLLKGKFSSLSLVLGGGGGQVLVLRRLKTYTFGITASNH